MAWAVSSGTAPRSPVTNTAATAPVSPGSALRIWAVRRWRALASQASGPDEGGGGRDQAWIPEQGAGGADLLEPEAARHVIAAGHDGTGGRRQGSAGGDAGARREAAGQRAVRRRAAQADAQALRQAGIGHLPAFDGEGEAELVPGGAGFHGLDAGGEGGDGAGGEDDMGGAGDAPLGGGEAGEHDQQQGTGPAAAQ
jgi:hypothetical protein